MLTIGEPVGVVDHALLNFCMQCRNTLIVERNFTAYKDIKHNAKTPHVHFWPSIGSRLKKFWRGKVKTATERAKVAAGREQVAKAKIDDFDVARLADQNILNLQVAMHDRVAVAVIECAGDLTAEFAGGLLLKLAVRNNVVQHLSPVDILKKHIPVVVGTDNITKTTDVGVIE